MAIFLVTLLVLWLPLALPAFWIFNRDPNLLALVTMPILYIIFIGLVQWWGKRIHNHPNLLKRYGLVATRKNARDLGKGLILGWGICLGIFVIQGLLGWLLWRSPSEKLAQIILEGLGIALVVGLVEELVFRGWLLDELERDYSANLAMWISAIIYALLHFLKPLGEIIRTLPQLPALIGLGLILVKAKRSHQGLLGIAIGIHMGLIWAYYCLNVGNLIEYTQVVPIWITGIDNNPLAGLMGWLGLLILGYSVYAKKI
ncbi:CPBP family intramembrane glutamic endopeptidase [Gloeocapsa sp. PCC 73106]|uniref:CPBP family intramembrane glutamic endopeptidase n=1 Tax=Gloeocapsa sp. PCC 73106 TaxID=102232 RepID=UPI0002ABACFA|nr:CPBP family intramembrane glutamic endopeptidase [Gloeocapsa sp. PCC 73106]ELR99530.1 CAAX amino terminal protease family [Gloeocapsa sp. PCC 73106]